MLPLVWNKPGPALGTRKGESYLPLRWDLVGTVREGTLSIALAGYGQMPPNGIALEVLTSHKLFTFYLILTNS